VAAPSNLNVRPASMADAAAIAAIYNHYILKTVVTFEEVEVDAAAIAERMTAVAEANLPWLVAVRNDAILGYAYASTWSARAGYRYSVEVTVYLDPARGGMGLGSALYVELFALLKARSIRNVIGGIALPNVASVALHEKFGMRQVAQYKDIGVKFGEWLDVGYWQGTL
jgi:L-amino acid N-acyltransferase YncA